MRLVNRMAFSAQKVLLWLSYHYHRIFSPKPQRDSISWVVGPDEIASMLSQIAAALPHSYSVSLSSHPFYRAGYDWDLSTKPHRLGWFSRSRVFMGPLLLGRLLNQAKGIVYVGPNGFLMSAYDQRGFEFAFIRARGLKLCCYWTGNDIRSNKLMHEWEAETGEPNVSTYQGYVSPALETESYDESKRAMAAVADEHAEVMFGFPAGMRSYLTRPLEPSMYFYPDEAIATDLAKFDELSPLVLVHAPSSPIGKGTPLVRAAIAQLRQDGFEFDYVELVGMPNERVLSELSRAHIALNHFYGSQPGVFGIEAMAAGCVMFTSADERVETTLPPGSNQAWVVTKHHEVYTNLKRAMDDPAQLRPTAERAIDWVREHASMSRSATRLQRIMDSVLDGTYRPSDY